MLDLISLLQQQKIKNFKKTYGEPYSAWDVLFFLSGLTPLLFIALNRTLTNQNEYPEYIQRVYTDLFSAYDTDMIW